ncbi:hypothetical protein [Bacillus solimangrovi]|uniref:Uncharacterized protein n=1 Tax=Bacillus solimangrovi TaxID=1305675 RepID=A0A1E5LFQ5_9BACI|nr:hypothetical protein [Bacillus solimangrovi]OEH92902.1 hypothetical protein BFG57_14605 [Bacillus solimangrovi]
MMRNSFVRVLFMFIMMFLLIQFRYSILNAVLRMTLIRRFAVSSLMRMPWLRGLFMRQMFKY